MRVSVIQSCSTVVTGWDPGAIMGWARYFRSDAADEPDRGGESGAGVKSGQEYAQRRASGGKSYDRYSQSHVS